MNKDNTDKLWDEVGDYAREWLVKFVKTTQTLFADEKLEVDLIVVAGNSGVALVRFLKLILDRLDIPMPKVLELPIVRYLPGKKETQINLFDNSGLVSLAKQKLTGMQFPSSVLFVDDEICGGTTAFIAMQAVLSVFKPVVACTLRYYIVAEDQGFDPKKWERLPSPVHVTFVPYAREVPGLNNIIAYNVPYKISSRIRRYYDDKELDAKAVMSILLGGPVKKFVDGVPKFTFMYTQLLQKQIPEFSLLQKQYRRYLKRIIDMV